MNEELLITQFILLKLASLQKNYITTKWFKLSILCNANLFQQIYGQRIFNSPINSFNIFLQHDGN